MHLEETVLFSSKFNIHKENERDGTLFDNKRWMGGIFHLQKKERKKCILFLVANTTHK
jgi:hypothetical protein